MLTEELIEQPITLTENAVNYLNDILSQQDNKDVLNVRIYVSGGGCSGLQYGMALDELVDIDDKVYKIDGLNVVLSDMDTKYLKGAIVDYVTTNMGGGFKIENPMAVKSCGCGSSFSVEDDAGGKTVTGSCGSCKY